jgi:Uma2 family endonuclease
MSRHAPFQTESKRSWEEICDDPFLAQLPYRIETDRWGNLVMIPPPRRQHAEYQGEIEHLLRLLLKNGRSLPECPLQTTEGVKTIDVVWISDERRKSHPVGACYLVAPEICVEIQSPSNSEEEFFERRRLYFEKNATEVWVCDLEGNLSFFDPDGPLVRSRLCPEFPTKIVLFQIAFKMRLIRLSFGPLASLLARRRSPRICFSLAPRQRSKIRRVLVSS